MLVLAVWLLSLFRPISITNLVFDSTFHCFGLHRLSFDSTFWLKFMLKLYSLDLVDYMFNALVTCRVLQLIKAVEYAGSA